MAKKSIDDLNKFKQSPEAKKEGVCHTVNECRELFLAIDPEVRVACKKMLLEKVPLDDQKRVRQAIKVAGTDWIEELCKDDPMSRMFVGMGFRNFLRRHGFGEEALQVHNLDCVYENLIEEAFQE